MHEEMTPCCVLLVAFQIEKWRAIEEKPLDEWIDTFTNLAAELRTIEEQIILSWHFILTLFSDVSSSMSAVCDAI